MVKQEPQNVQIFVCLNEKPIIQSAMIKFIVSLPQKTSERCIFSDFFVPLSYSFGIHQIVVACHYIRWFFS